jgi:hypothetical protein
MASENNCNLGFGQIFKTAFAVTVGVGAGKCLCNLVENKLIPAICDKVIDIKERVKDLKAKKTEEALKIDDK